MFMYEGTNNLVSGAFLKCFSIYSKQFKSFEPHLDLYQSLYDFFDEA